VLLFFLRLARRQLPAGATVLKPKMRRFAACLQEIRHILFTYVIVYAAGTFFNAL